MLGSGFVLTARRKKENRSFEEEISSTFFSVHCELDGGGSMELRVQASQRRGHIRVNKSREETHSASGGEVALLTCLCVFIGSQRKINKIIFDLWSLEISVGPVDIEFVAMNIIFHNSLHIFYSQCYQMIVVDNSF